MRSIVLIIFLLFGVLAVSGLAAQTLEENEIAELRRKNQEMLQQLESSRETPNSDELTDLRRENLDLLHRLERQEQNSSQRNSNDDSESDANKVSNKASSNDSNDASSRDPNSWGQKFAIGIPIGVLSDELLTGMEFTIPYSRFMALRIEAITLLKYKGGDSGLTDAVIANAVIAPGVGLILRSTNLSNQVRFYGMYLLNTHYDVFQKEAFSLNIGIYLIGGVEYFLNEHLSLFGEAGGGFRFGKEEYGSGPMFSFGTRIFR